MRYLVDVEFHKDYVRVDGGLIKVGLTSIPEKGKANMELMKELAKSFGIPSSNIIIISGLKSRRKIVEIRR